MIENDDRIIELLRASGPRAAVPVERATRVRRAVHAGWRQSIRARRRRRIVGVAAGLTAAAAALIAIRINDGDSPSADLAQPVLATVTTGGSSERRLITNEPFVADEAPASLRLTDGAEVRVARGGRLRLTSAGEIELTDGAIYIDTHGGSTGVTVRTPFGEVRDVGTRFEVRLQDGSLRVRVREGTIELTCDGETRRADAGTALTARRAGGVTSAPTALSGADWEWVSALAPPFEIEGHTLADYLDYLSREHGWIIRFETPRLRERAAETTLHGSITGLRASDALAVALRTSGLAHRFHGDVVTIRKAQE